MKIVYNLYQIFILINHYFEFILYSERSWRGSRWGGPAFVPSRVGGWSRGSNIMSSQSIGCGPRLFWVWNFISHWVALCPNAPYFIILLCLMPDDFTHQGERAGALRVKTVIAYWLEKCLKRCCTVRSVHVYKGAPF
jgi:hypothetical protein